LGFGVRSRHSEQAKTTGKRRSAAEEREEAKRQRLGGGGDRDQDQDQVSPFVNQSINHNHHDRHSRQ
jgi:hypothetical protein